MKYYLIAGEASGDLHASRLMRSLKGIDKDAVFRFFGGDQMAAEGGTLVKHYRELAYMGFIPVLLHLPTILKNMKRCKQDIISWRPDCLILIDYPGFNLDIAKYIKSRTKIPVYYYISPKIWAWKEYRIKNIKRDVDELFSILPFEVDFFEKKHHYPIHYVGNPTADEVREYLSSSPREENEKVIALLAGSRKQEIKDNLPAMIEAVRPMMQDYRVVLAGAPGVEQTYYTQFIEGTGVEVLFNVPQVVCYETPIPKIVAFFRKHIIHVKYISLVNLIADSEVVTELVADTFSVENIRRELEGILHGPAREKMLQGYAEVYRRLGEEKAPDNAAGIMYNILNKP